MKLLLGFLSVTLLVHSTHGHGPGCVKINIGRPNDPFFVPKDICNSVGPVSSVLASCTPTTKSLYSFNNADCSGTPAGSYPDMPLEAGESCADTDQNCVVNFQSFADTECSKPEQSLNLAPNACLNASNSKFSCLGPNGEYTVIETYNGAYCSGDVIEVTAFKVGKRIVTSQSDQCTGGRPPTLPDATPDQGQFILAQVFETSCDPTTVRTFLQGLSPDTCDPSNEKAYCVNEGAGLVIVSYSQAGCKEPVLMQKLTDLSCVNGGVVVSCFDESNAEPPPVSDLGENVIAGELFNDPFCTQKYGRAIQKVDTCSFGNGYTCQDEETLVITKYANAGDCSGVVNSRTEVAVGICQPFRNGFIKLEGKCPQMIVSEDDSDDDGRPNKRGGGKRGRGNGPPGKYGKRNYKQNQGNRGNKVRGRRYSPSRKSYRVWKGY